MGFISTVVAALLKNVGATLALIMCLALAGCGTTLSGVIKGDKSVALEDSRTRVTRNQTIVAGSLPIALQTGDEINTGPDSTAVVRFASGSEVYLRPNSEIRIGSLECMGFCELFVKVKGIFRVQTVFASAGAEGTSFYVKYEPGRALAVVVTEGRVKLEPAQKGNWDAISLQVAETAEVTSTRSPRKGSATREELLEIQEWVPKVELLAPKTGLTTGQTIGVGAAIAAAIAIIAVSRSGSDDTDEAGKKPPEGGKPPEPSGYCCIDYSIEERTEKQCIERKGRFSRDRASLQQQCKRTYPGSAIKEKIRVRPPEPIIR